jgi:hypothetical protein
MICNIRHGVLNFEQKTSSENQLFSELVSITTEDIMSDVASRICLCPKTTSLYCNMYMHCKAT